MSTFAQAPATPAGQPSPPHLTPPDVVLARAGSDAERGLSEQEAAERLERDGPNALVEGDKRSLFAVFVAQLRDFMILVLLAAALISGLLGDAVDTAVILSIVVLNAMIGFVQEVRAERAMAALKALSTPQATVTRGGQQRVIPARELVAGDVVLLEAGQAVPADARLFALAQLRIDESALTGESVPVDKTVAQLEPGEHDGVGERRNMAFKGTLVTAGRGRAVVTATGMRTELGRIAQLLTSASRVQTPLQVRLARFGRVLSVVVLLLCAMLFGLGLLRGEPPLRMLLTAISLAVAAIPEALPAVVSVSLALGARAMVRHHVLVRKLPAVETLGSVTYICSDKTGTLTENRMRVDALVYGDQTHPLEAGQAPGDAPEALLLAMLLNNDATPDDAGVLLGDPTEVALYEAAQALGLDAAELRASTPRLTEIPFDADRARMTTVHRMADGVRAFVKGAPERVLPRCTQRLTASGVVPLERERLLSTAEALAASGRRVLAFAMRELPDVPDTPDPDRLERALCLVGLAALIDPPRAAVARAVAICRDAGIVPVMITGDHPATALAIAREVGIADDGEAVTGAQLQRAGDDEVDALVSRARVYARTSPEQKIRIVEALQAQGQFVAMTGDGVNDAPALKRANIGVAMGLGGTDVAREAADMVLLDDRFHSIVAAVREGRRIFDNIRKFVRYTMTSNSGELWTLVLAPLLGLPIPLLPVHILWVNLITDGLPGLALATEPEERAVMQRPPRPPSESLFAHGLWQHILVVGLIMGLVSLGSMLAAMAWGWPWQTVVFTVLTLSQLGHALAVRSERESLLSRRLGKNHAMTLAVLVCAALQLSVIYVPPLRRVFHTDALNPLQLGFCLGASSVVFIAVELEKLVRRNPMTGLRALSSKSPDQRDRQ